MKRRYEETHPWLTFHFKPGFDGVSAKLGEAFSKCQHLSGTPLQPAIALHLAQVYLAKGVHATTAIEGNTLSEDEVIEILDKQRSLPPSQDYLQREIENMRSALIGIGESALQGSSFVLTPDWLKEQNELILAGADCEDHVVPGRFTEKQLLVGNVYRAAPPEDVPFLVDQLCAWINSMLEATGDDEMPSDMKFFNIFYAAVLGHLYLVWIHPFGDGNGRTARALECAILAHSGVVPWISSNLLSNHYNRTRSRYGSRLAAASRDRDVDGFVAYAANGFVDMLREQIGTVQAWQRRVAWVNFVHELFQNETQGTTSKRRRALVLAMPEGETQRADLRRLTPELAEMYALVGDKALSHDTNRLRRLGLIEGSARKGFWPLISTMDAFMPRA